MVTKMLDAGKVGRNLKGLIGAFYNKIKTVIFHLKMNSSYTILN